MTTAPSGIPRAEPDSQHPQRLAASPRSASRLLSGSKGGEEELCTWPRIGAYRSSVRAPAATNARGRPPVGHAARRTRRAAPRARRGWPATMKTIVRCVYAPSAAPRRTGKKASRSRGPPGSSSRSTRSPRRRASRSRARSARTTRGDRRREQRRGEQRLAAVRDQCAEPVEQGDVAVPKSTAGSRIDHGASPHA